MMAIDLFDELSSRYAPIFTATLLLVGGLFLASCSYSGNLGQVSCDEDQPCAAGSTCIDGFCIFEGDAAHLPDAQPDADECAADQLECNGQCVAIDEANCGSCGNTCGDDELCEDAQCVVDTSCEAGQEYCEAEQSCRDLTSDLNNCGSCGNTCDDPTEATATCEASSCVYTCPDASLDYCSAAGEGDRCRNLQSDNDFCGACDNFCDNAQQCVEGYCIDLACNPSIEDNFGGGQGTVDDPYLICSPAQLNLVGTDATYLGLHFQVSAPIDLSDITDFQMIGAQDIEFTGTFDGKGHAIENLIILPEDTENMTDANDFIGMFRDQSGELRNINLVNAEVQGRAVVGILVGGNRGIIEDSAVSGTVTGIDRVGGLVGATGNDTSQIINSTADVQVSGGEFTGGLVGRNNGIITGSTATGDVAATDRRSGGLVGQNWVGVDGPCEIIDSHASGQIFGENTVGGLVGVLHVDCSITGSTATNIVDGSVIVGGLVGWAQDNTTITDSHATGTVDGTNPTGGLVGLASGLIQDSYAQGAASGTNNVGGLIGELESAGEIQNSYAEGNITGAGGIGGLVGYSKGSITTAYAIGDITSVGGQAGGGFVGINEGLIADSYATGNFTANDDFDLAGGFVGYSEESISGSYATGNITITGSGEDVGGFVGQSRVSTISASFATGDINTENIEYVGGFVGYIYDNGIIEDSYALGNSTGDTFVGGFAGNVQANPTNGEIQRSYSTGDALGNDEVGGFCGRDQSNNISQSYWNSESTTATGPFSDRGTEIDTTELADEATFTDWDFTNIWEMDATEGRPRLQHEE